MPPEVTEKVIVEPEAVTPDALAVITERLREGVSASPLCVAILGWLCDVDTDPYIVVIRLRGSQVVLRASDEKITAPFGPLTEFLGQIALLCDSLGLTEAQTQNIVDAARQRLGAS